MHIISYKTSPNTKFWLSGAQDYGAYLEADAVAAAASCREMDWALQEVLRLAEQCDHYKSDERYDIVVCASEEREVCFTLSSHRTFCARLLCREGMCMCGVSTVSTRTISQKLLSTPLNPCHPLSYGVVCMIQFSSFC